MLNKLHGVNVEKKCIQLNFDKRVSANNALNSTSNTLIGGKKLKFKESEKLLK